MSETIRKRKFNSLNLPMIGFDIVSFSELIPCQDVKRQQRD